MLVKVPERLAVAEGLPFEDPEIRKEYLALLKKARAKGEKIWDCDFKTAMSPSSHGGVDIRENLRLAEHYRPHGFKEAEELLDFIEAFRGLTIPRVKVCPGHTPPFQHLVEGEALRTRTHLVNGSNIQILTASSKSVRGPHPQVLKVGEVDEFEDRIYEAALLIPKSARGIRASVPIYSIMHKAYSLMNRVITEAAQSGYWVYKWCIFCVMEKCIGRDCDACELWEDCEGRARQADGFYPVEDAISAERKVSRETWKSEMLCRMPSQDGLIYKECDLSIRIF